MKTDLCRHCLVWAILVAPLVLGAEAAEQLPLAPVPWTGGPAARRFLESAAGNKSDGHPRPSSPRVGAAGLARRLCAAGRTHDRQVPRLHVGRLGRVQDFGRGRLQPAFAPGCRARETSGAGCGRHCRRAGRGRLPDATSAVGRAAVPALFRGDDADLRAVFHGDICWKPQWLITRPPDAASCWKWASSWLT